jgi:hypothetical protein
LARAFRHLRDCDAALHRRRGGIKAANLAATIVALLIGNFARGYGGNRNKWDDPHHDHVRGFLPLILGQARIASRPPKSTFAHSYCRPNATTAREN